MTLEKQIREWKRLKNICYSIKQANGEYKQRQTDNLYKGIKQYYHTYKEKFDIINMPKKSKDL